MNGEENDSGKWILHGERSVYETEWLKLRLADVSQPSGNRYEHHIVALREAVLIVLLNDAHDQVLMGRRHRFVSDAWSWEIPGGHIEPGESPETAAIRELREETGYVPSHMDRMFSFEPMIGTIRCTHHVYLALGAAHEAEPVEENEGRFQWISLDEAQHLLQSGHIRAVGTLAALLHLFTFGPSRQSARDNDPK